MTNTQNKQYLIKKAERGLVRFQGLQKAAAVIGLDNGNFDPLGFATDAPPQESKPAFPSPLPEKSVDISGGNTNGKDYLPYAATGAGVGALIGTLINLVRNKSLLSGALIGAGIGGGLGAGHKALMDNNSDYAASDFAGTVEPYFQKAQDTYNNVASKLGK